MPLCDDKEKHNLIAGQLQGNWWGGGV